jgi:hypothetical protein
MARSPIAVTTTLSRPDGTTVQLDRANAASAAEYAKPSGAVYRVAVPRPLVPGAYRLAVDVSLARAHVSREVAFRIVPR